MADRLKDVEAEALLLGLEARASLAETLLLSLDELSEEETGRLWIEEARRRLDELRRGAVEGVPADDVFRGAVQAIS